MVGGTQPIGASRTPTAFDGLLMITRELVVSPEDLENGHVQGGEEDERVCEDLIGCLTPVITAPTVGILVPPPSHISYLQNLVVSFTRRRSRPDIFPSVCGLLADGCWKPVVTNS